jgi:hypothetical protein
MKTNSKLTDGGMGWLQNNVRGKRKKGFPWRTAYNDLKTTQSCVKHHETVQGHFLKFRSKNLGGRRKGNSQRVSGRGAAVGERPMNQTQTPSKPRNITTQTKAKTARRTTATTHTHTYTHTHTHTHTHAHTCPITFPRGNTPEADAVWSLRM